MDMGGGEIVYGQISKLLVCRAEINSAQKRIGPWNWWGSRDAAQMLPSNKNPPKMWFIIFVKLTGYTSYACNSLTNFKYEAHGMTGNRNQVNLLKFAWKSSWNNIKWTYFWRILAIWNHCVLCRQSNSIGFWWANFQMMFCCGGRGCCSLASPSPG